MLLRPTWAAPPPPSARRTHASPRPAQSHRAHTSPQFIPPPFQESPAKWQIWGLHADVDQIEPDQRIRRNWAFRRRPLPGGRLGGECEAASRAPSPARSVAPPPTPLRPLPSFLRPFPSFLRRQEPARARPLRHPAVLKRRFGNPSGCSRRTSNTGNRLGSCLRRNDGTGNGVGDRGAHEQWRQFGTPTPHLTSPLKGGRDELGRAADLERSVNTL